ncbi:MAG: hypothetical protein KDD66_15095, partial [Bdellovibrionales bacterium]|nr:hypothetical protein [Bdellovibrionales bacterium]
MDDKDQTCSNKALELNLDDSIYGTIAEIGAGQEVARQMFRVGAASGTVAKTMSAYDMRFSDDIYGPVKRYVSRERLVGMLDHEYSLLLERLNEQRGEKTRFFAFADTVAARNFRGTNECHGWMGVRFQVEPRGEDNEIILHVRMLDQSNVLQAEALGVFGINVLYGAYHYWADPEKLICSLADGIGTERIEVEAIEFNGPAFENVNQRELNLVLLEQRLNRAVLFSKDRRAELASEVLYKRPVLLLRGSFRPFTNANLDMLESGLKQFKDEAPLEGKEPLIVLEMTVKNLLEHNIEGRKSLLDLADSLSTLGYPILITDYREYYRLSQYLRRYTSMPVTILIGPNNLYHVFDESFYEDLSGGILEAFGRLFRNRIKMYVYPMARGAFEHYFSQRGISQSELGTYEDDYVTADNLKVVPKQQALFEYLKESGLIRSMKHFHKNLLNIHSSDVRAKIQA